MPWCFECEAYRAPSAVRRDGSCPACGETVDPGRLATAGEQLPPPSDEEAREAEEAPPAPWHLKLLGVAVAGYLGLRAWQGVDWILQRLGG